MFEPLSTILHWIAERSKDKNYRFLSLAHHITPLTLKNAYMSLEKRAATGVDGQRWHDYHVDHEPKLEELHERLKTRQYRAVPVRRTWIPKEGSSKGRPLGICCLEDKIVQRAVKTLLTPLYEEEFYDFSYGYRPKRNCHQAIKHLYRDIRSQNLKWIIDADISNYFNDIQHSNLHKFIKQRVVDGTIHRLIGKWLNCGVLDDGQLLKPENGISQGASISPLLANIYLHYVLDEWFVESVEPRMAGRVSLLRFADDFVIACEHESDARRIMTVLPKRLEKFGLTLNSEKTRLVDFGKPHSGKKKGRGSFSFLGFLFYWGKSRKGYFVVKLKTQSQRIQSAYRRIDSWCKQNRHMPVKEQVVILNKKLQGHYNYYGVTFNAKCLSSIYYRTRIAWFKWLRRRGGKNQLTWQKFEAITEKYPLKTAHIKVNLFA